MLSSDTQSYYAEYIHIVHFYIILMNRFSVIGWVSYIMGSKAIGDMSFPYYLLIILMYFLHQSLNCKPYLNLFITLPDKFVLYGADPLFFQFGDFTFISSAM